MKSAVGIAFALMTVLLMASWTEAELRVKSTQQQNDEAARKVERKFKQYKRVHQEILKKIVEGKETQALDELEMIQCGSQRRRISLHEGSLSCQTRYAGISS